MLTRSMSKLIKSALFNTKKAKKQKKISDFPTELKFCLFNSLTITELSRLALTNKPMCQLIREYVNLKSSRKRLIPDVHCDFSEENLDIFKQIGILVKRLTIVMCTRVRMDFMLEFINLNFCNPKDKCLVHDKCTSNQMLGQTLKMFCSGWTAKECHELYRRIDSIQPRNAIQVKSMFNVKDKYIEPIQLRKFHRQIFLDPYILRSEIMAWLKIVTSENCYNNDMIANFLYILYGPVINGDIVNDSLATFSLDIQSTTMRMVELGCCLDIFAKTLQNPDNIVDIVLRITRMGNTTWSDDRLSHFIYMCGCSITVSVMRYMAVKHKRVGAKLASLLYVTMQYAEDVSWAVSLLPEIVIKTNKRHTVTAFYYDLVDSCQKRIQSEIVSDEDNMETVNDLVSALSALTKEYMIKFIKSHEYKTSGLLSYV